jgi:hypothetical protein
MKGSALIIKKYEYKNRNSSRNGDTFPDRM